MKNKKKTTQASKQAKQTEKKQGKKHLDIFRTNLNENAANKELI